MLSWIIGGSNNQHEWFHNGIITPSSQQDYEMVAKEALDTTLSMVDSDGWSLVVKKGRVTVEEKYVSESQISMIRVSTDLQNVNLEDIVNFIHAPSNKQRKAAYPKLIAHETIDRISGNIIVARSTFNAPFPVTNREFLAMRVKRRCDDGSYLIACRSVNRQDREFDPNFVRGTSTTDVHVSPIPGTNNVRVVQVDHVNPRGWIPYDIINSFKSTMGDWLINVQKQYVNHIY